MITWIGTQVWDTDADDLIDACKGIIQGSSITSEENIEHIARLFDRGSTRRFDFIRAYDSKMNIIDNRPGNFNRNAKRNCDIFLSYTFVSSWMGVDTLMVHIGCKNTLNVHAQPSLGALCSLVSCILIQRT